LVPGIVRGIVNPPMEKEEEEEEEGEEDEEDEGLSSRLISTIPGEGVSTTGGGELAVRGEREDSPEGFRAANINMYPSKDHKSQQRNGE
jgi:hypothetical protein